MTPLSSPKARRLGVMLALCLAIEASAPAPASAWFGWVDRWSGPGKFWGLLYEGRLMCFGPSSGIPEILAAYERAQQSTRGLLRGARTEAERARFTDDWLAVFGAVRAAQLQWNIADSDKTEESKRTDASELQTFRGESISPEQLESFVKRADTIVQNTVNNISRQAVTLGGTGIFWSACSDEKERRVSIELNVNDYYGFDNENNATFSNGTSIRMITFMPSVTYSIFKSSKAEIDIGMAAGYYAFSSKGFARVHGFIVEPVRVDLHAPSAWAAEGGFKRVVSLFTFRAGVLTIPSGFSANAFARRSHDGPIEAEIVPAVGLFFNLNSLLAKKRTLTPTLPSGAKTTVASRSSGAAGPW